MPKVCLFLQPVWPLSKVGYAQQSGGWTILSIGLLPAFPRKKMLLGQNFPEANTNVLAVVPSRKWQTLACNLFAECTDTRLGSLNAARRAFMFL